MRRVKLAVAQITVHIGDKEYNLSRIAALAAQAGAAGADLVCFSEMATTGYIADKMTELAEPIPGPTTEVLCDTARQHHLWLIAGMPETNPAGLPFNAVVIVNPAGEIQTVYRKINLFPGEIGKLTPGREPCLVDLGFAKAGVVICYDFVFPHYVASLVDRGAELILHPTAWLTTPAKQAMRYNPEGYRAMCMTRAVENTVWLISANQSGLYDDTGNMHAVGRSSIIAPWAEVLAEVPVGEGLGIAEVDFDAAAPWRERIAPYLVERKRHTW